MTILNNTFYLKRLRAVFKLIRRYINVVIYLLFIITCHVIISSSVVPPADEYIIAPPFTVLQWPVCKPYIKPCMAIDRETRQKEEARRATFNRRPAQHLCLAQPSSPHARVRSPSPCGIGNDRVLCEPIAKGPSTQTVRRTSPCARMTYDPRITAHSDV